ncbi:MAG: phenylacetate-CoA oxygenase/reductase subunit PaaK [Flavobacteriales bacterium]|jgi:ring-1,2-phenylacetyl-CoA epoxidase subunit PaaE|nr:phenylacetate-CoA oxygenase/reductase subunit PaaK [Flavobacteriales bacterium]NCG29147.1 phenylacetate-CoA oxygenase/reductase subunit PaaK [Bacteroidota bacterium]MBT3963194.1 phenylacetate-CoA oxygenase/reductase subunit PaaK [Flavobacteriales bacterium]MBT4705844.1 phenylacetate-CoA oxygenase/reductase subunit PaaK [Flavobacteriales bacterium]MBT4931592.1 phenylacetate-CoA oxygenase/reductase subunit PaaK [Flavobacteriales bacterium]
MPKFHSLKVSDIKRETEDAVSVSFEVPRDLEDDYKFKQGQYLTFKMDIGGEELRRSYSICRSPLDNDLRVAIKKVENGRFSSFANDELKVGDVLEVMTPLGRFYTEVDPQNDKRYVAFAAGSGITPVMAHMRTILATEPKSEFTLIYSNKYISSIIFKEEIEDLKNEYMDRLRVFHVLSREASDVPHLHGRIDEDKCNTFLKYFIEPSTINDVFICGPAPMVDSVKESLINAGVDKKSIHFELFASPQQLAERKGEEKPEQFEGVAAKVKIIIDGVETDFNMASTSENVLDSALKHGADLPFACKGGVCATCRAKLEEGEVHMDLNYSLEPDDLARGFILTCQSHPKTDSIVVNFDEV